MSRIHALLGSMMSPPQNNHLTQIAYKPGFLTNAECDAVIRLAAEQQTEAGTLGSDQSMKETTRRSNVSFLLQTPDSEWLYQKMGNEVHSLNSQAYGFDINGFEPVQVGTYGVDDHYDWHLDVGDNDNSTRKISMSIQLSDPADYDGGNLEFFKVETPDTRARGTVIFFPSYLHHRITPVTRGIRKSLVGWVHGPAYR